MSSIALLDGRREQQEWIEALLGLARRLEHWTEWATSLDAHDPRDATLDPPTPPEVLDCLLGIAALAAKLEPELRSWSSGAASSADDKPSTALPVRRSSVLR